MNQDISIERQTGWRRPYPVSICQDHDVLLSITQYDYDFSAPGFADYFVGRTGMLFPPDPRAQDALTDHSISKESYFKMLRVVGEYGHPSRIGEEQTDAELETDWKVVKIFRGKAQDCWELFQQKHGI